MTRGGFAGRVLEVDLTRQETRALPLEAGLAEKYVGGLGLSLKLAYDHLRPGTKPLAPDNCLVLGAGPLVGTNLPASSRVYGVTKLPANGAVGWSGAGGMSFGCLLKNAGYDHLIIRGRAEQPVFLQLSDDQVELGEAGFLWGRGVAETSEALWESWGRPAGVLAIGPAGENLVSFSMAYLDRLATLGRGGLGAVMGSKNLKAVVVRGTRGVRLADRERSKALTKALLQQVREYPHLKECQELGLVRFFPHIPRDIYRRIKKRRLACVSCPLGDKDVVEIPDGEFQGLVRCSTSVVNLFMPLMFGFSDYREAIKAVAVLDEFGLDMFEFFGLLALGRELSRQGILRPDRLEEEIRPDSLKAVQTWAQKIAFREGLGAVLAEGFPGVFREFGPAAEQCAPAVVKGLLPYVGPRGPFSWDLFGTMELGQVLDPRGPHVSASGSPTYFRRRPLEVFPRHLIRMGAPPEALPRILPGSDAPGQEPGLRVGRLLRYSQTWFTILGSLGLCARAQINRFYDAALCAELYEAVTGIETDLEGLRHRASRVWTLLRLANIREGFTRKDDAPPEKWFEGPGFKDYLTGEPLGREDMEEMIEDYYDEWGWDPKTGVPTPERVRELGLSET